MKLDILDYSVHGNEADTESDALLKAASEALGYTTRIVLLQSEKHVPELQERVWLRYDLRSRRELAWIVSVAENLEKKGHQVFPSARSILLSEDKWETHLTLLHTRLPLIETHDLSATDPGGATIVLKPRVGWGGMGMKLLENGADVLSQLLEEKKEYIWQPFIPHRQTWTVVMAGKSLLSILEKRATSNDFRTNFHFGEEALEASDPGGAGDRAALALDAVGLVAGGVDLIEADGQLKVLEVNSAPCLWYDNLPALDLAGPMVHCVMEWMDRFKEESI